jgi:serine/tyrosine/threonine adenylyltransferase
MAVSVDNPYIHPFWLLNYATAVEGLGGDYWDEVTAAEFPAYILRFRNNYLLPTLGLKSEAVQDEDFIEAFGRFHGPRPFLAWRYHGYQFGEYNPFLGDGRGFLYGQVWGIDGKLYDFGTKGSGRTPYSRTADGRLTLKGGVREVLAAEALHRAGVETSRCLSLIETGESLWRGDEPSPTRSSVMVRLSQSHIRFGTFERLHHMGRNDLIPPLLNHVIQYYYPHLWNQPESYERFYSELVQRVAKLVAQWMSVGFCHGVLNTDNMSVTGESFDYGPYAFIPTYDPNFTAAYFDYAGRYSYGNQPGICYWNLEMLQRPLLGAISQTALESGLAQFAEHYHAAYEQRMLNKLGFGQLPPAETEELLRVTLTFLLKSQVEYHAFFAALRQGFSPQWREDVVHILPHPTFIQSDAQAHLLQAWREGYFHVLLGISDHELTQIAQRLTQHNPLTSLLRPVIEAIWEPIAVDDHWLPFDELLKQLQAD